MVASNTPANGFQTTGQKKSTHHKLFVFGGAGAGVVGLSFVKHGNKRLGDSLVGAVQTLEEYSPLNIFRTFKYSELTSPLGSNVEFPIPPSLFHQNAKAREFLSTMTGKSMADLEQLGAYRQGLTFKRTGKVLGDLYVSEGAKLASNVMPINVGGGGNSFVDWFARTSNIRLAEGRGVLRTVSNPTKFAITVPKVDKVFGMPISEGAADLLTKFRLAGRFQRAYWAGQVGRLNRLLAAPSDWIPGLGKGLRRAGIHLPVKPGTAMEMMGRYAGKAMLIAGGIEAVRYLGYKRSQHEGRVSGGLAGGAIGGLVGGLVAGKMGAMVGGLGGGIIGSTPLFDRGIFEGFATGWTKLTKAGAGVSESLGLTQSAKEQEEFLPGITKAQTLAGFTLAGAVGGLFLGGFVKAYKSKKMGREAFKAMLEKEQGLVNATAQSMTPLFKKPGLGKLAFWNSREWAQATAKGASSRTARLMLRGGKLGMLEGAGTYAALAMLGAFASGHVIPGIFGAKHTKQELEDIYSGKTQVPVKKGRWWLFGASPFEGEKTNRFQAHWYHQMMTKARTKGLYGSEEEYWNQSSLLHPIKAVTDDEFKYRWEMQHYYDRPYPATGGFGNDIPFIGPLVAGSIGKVIKPTRIMHSDQLTGANGLPTNIPTAGSSEPSYELGGLAPAIPVDPNSMKQALGEFIYRTNELRGLTGFIHNAVKERLTGNEYYFANQPQIETADIATSVRRAYWEQELGDPVGLTEPLRRFITRKRPIPGWNPIQNQMPSWIPGPEAIQDLQHGDPYSKLQGGDYRLPGAGYEALYPEVAGINPEDYPLIHKYRILSDVALFSEKQKMVSRQVDAAIKHGQFNDQQLAEAEVIREQVRQKKASRKISEYRYHEQALEASKAKVKDVLAPGVFEAEGGQVYKLSGVKLAHDEIASKNAETLATPSQRMKQVQVSDYLREYIYPGAELDVYVHKDALHRYGISKQYGTYQHAVIESNGQNVGRNTVDAGLATYDEKSPFYTATKYTPFQRKVGALWETTAHFESPTEKLIPLSPMAKFVHQRSAIEEYEKSRVFSTENSFWQHPLKQFIEPAYHEAKHMLGSGAIPADTLKRWEVEEYFDRLAWMKYHMLGKIAENQGNYEAANQYKKLQQNTLFGVNPFGNPANIMRSIPKLDRDFYKDFSDASSAKERARILSVLPDQEKPIYLAQWAKSLEALQGGPSVQASADGAATSFLDAMRLARTSEGHPIDDNLRAMYANRVDQHQRYADWIREKEAAEYFQDKPLPGPNYVAWHPEVDLEDVKLKTLNSLGLDVHNSNLWESRQRELGRKPYLEGSETEIAEAFAGKPQQPDGIPQAFNGKVIESLLRDNFRLEDIQIANLPGPPGKRIVEVDIRDDRRSSIQKYKKDRDYQEMS